MPLPKAVEEAIDRLAKDYQKDRKSGPVRDKRVKGIGRTGRYVDDFANLMVGDGGVSGPGRISTRTYNEGDVVVNGAPVKGFWDPKTRKLGIQNPPEDMHPEEAQDELNALVVHETGHIRHTDPELFERHPELKKDESLKALVNIFEDPRVEERQIDDNPGVVKQVKGLRHKLLNECLDAMEEGKSNPFSVVLSAASEVSIYEDLRRRDFYVETLKADFPEPGVAEEAIDEIVDAAREALKAKDSEEVVGISKRIREKYFPKQEEQEGDGEGEGEGGGEGKEGSGSGSGKGKSSGKGSSGKSAAEKKAAKARAEAIARDLERVKNMLPGTKVEDFCEGGSQPADTFDDEETEDPSRQYGREDEGLGGREWSHMLDQGSRVLESGMWTRMQKFGAMAMSEREIIERTGRLDMRTVVHNEAASRFSLDMFRSEQTELESTFRLLLVLDGSGSMQGNPTNEGCKIAYALARKQLSDPAFKVRILLCNSQCRNALLIKDYEIPLTQSGSHALRTFRSNGAGEGLRTSDPYFKHPVPPDMALFLTDSQVDTCDIEWLRETRKHVPIRAAYVGGRTTAVEHGLSECFGANGYILKNTAEELGSHLDRLLNTFVRSCG